MLIYYPGLGPRKREVRIEGWSSSINRDPNPGALTGCRGSFSIQRTSAATHCRPWWHAPSCPPSCPRCPSRKHIPPHPWSTNPACQAIIFCTQNRLFPAFLQPDCSFVAVISHSHRYLIAINTTSLPHQHHIITTFMRLWASYYSEVITFLLLFVPKRTRRGHGRETRRDERWTMKD